VFQGETVTDTLVKLLEREPDWSQLPPRTPTSLRKLVQRCLTKDPKNRLQAIGDARTLIEELIADPAARAIAADGPAYPLWKKLLPWAAAPVFLAAGFFLRPSGRTAGPHGVAIRLTVAVPAAVGTQLQARD
jgi:hypothetical protein